MSIYHASTSAISRGVGHSSTAKAAYIACEKIVDRVTGEVHNYTNKQGLEHSEIMLPVGLDCKKITAEKLWNKAEQSEIRKDARVEREWVISLPCELSKNQRIELSRELTQNLVDRYEVGAQYAIHEPCRQGDERNYHVHILTTTRKIDSNYELTEKSDIERDRKQCAKLGIAISKDQIIECREMIANKINISLEKANITEKVSHKSFIDQGIEKAPTIHLGREATYMERRGRLTELGEHNRQVKRYNELTASLNVVKRDIKQDQREINDKVYGLVSQIDQKYGLSTENWRVALRQEQKTRNEQQAKLAEQHMKKEQRELKRDSDQTSMRMGSRGISR